MTTGKKVALSLALVGTAVGYMIYTTVSSGDALEYYKHVDEVVQEPGQWQGRKVQLHGNVVAGSILKAKGTLKFRFALHENGRWLDVNYQGLVPDAFKDCAEIIVKGRVAEDGRSFTAETMSAKCPSKYEGKMKQVGCGEDLLPQVLSHRRGGAGTSSPTARR